MLVCLFPSMHFYALRYEICSSERNAARDLCCFLLQNMFETV